LLAQWDNYSVDYAKPEAYWSHDRATELVHISSQRGYVDLLVTPNHNCLLHKYGGGPAQFIKAEDYPVGRHFDQPNAGAYSPAEGAELTAAQIAFICMLQADAAWVRKPTAKIHVKRDYKKVRLQWMLEELAIEHTVMNAASKPDYLSVYLKVPAWAQDWLTFNGKQFTRKWTQTSIVTRQLFLEELLCWDRSGRSYVTTVKANADLVQEVATLTMLRTTLDVRRGTYSTKDSYYINFSKSANTYVGNFSKTVVPYTGKVYCVTMPKHTVIVRRHGAVSISSQSQQEPRVTVHLAWLTEKTRQLAEPAANRYRSDPNTDYHSLVAELAGIPRKPAKTLNLGAAYGMGKYKMGLKLAESGVPESEVDRIYNAYHSAVPYVKRLGELCMRAAQQRGYIKTLLGRRRHFNLYEPIQKRGGKHPPLPLAEASVFEPWLNIPLQRAFCHKALNAAVQGGSADMIKKAMVDLDDAGLDMIHITIHDELGISFETEKQLKDSVQCMLDCVKLEVPLKVDAEVGPSWGEAS
jgi:hypothetical protein